MPTLEATPTTLNPFHIMPPLNLKEEEEFYDPTPEELEKIRRGEENFRNGNYYAQREDETLDEFFYRMLREEE